MSEESIKIIEQNAIKYANNHMEDKSFYNDLTNKGYKYISVYEIINASNIEKSDINNINGFVKITNEDGIKAKYINKVKNVYIINYYANDYKLDKYLLLSDFSSSIIFGFVSHSDLRFFSLNF